MESPSIEYFNDIALIKGDSHISHWVKESGKLDHDDNALPIIMREIKAGSIVFDLGAYCGDHSIRYANKAHVIAFEPNPTAYECLVHNMKNKGVTCHNFAISDKVEKYDVIMPNENYGMAYIEANENGKYTSQTIDGYVKEYGVVPDFIKADIEGNEVKMLLGAVETIKKHHPKLVLEVNEGALERAGTSRKELFDLLDSYGYIYRDLYNKPLSSLSIQFDIICTKR